MFKFNIVSRYRYSLVAATTKAVQIKPNKPKAKKKKNTHIQLTPKSNRTWLIDATFMTASGSSVSDWDWYWDSDSGWYF